MIMPLITETYYLSLTQDNRGILRLRCSQDDTLRTVNLKLYNNGSIFVIPSGVSASVSGVKQNGAVFSKSCTISQDRKSVVLQLSSDITNVDGIIVAEIVLIDGEGGRLGTSNFIIQVEKNPIRAGVVQDTETPIEYINDFIEKIQTLTARVNNLITPNGDPSLAEVVDARMGILDSTTYQTLGARLNAEFQKLSNALNGITILKSTGDTADRTSEILSKLNVYGTCKLGKGDFYVKNLVMPEDSMLIGSGNATRIVLLGSETNTYIVKPKSGCIIEDISFDGGFTGTYSELIANSNAKRHCIILDKFNDANSENVILSNIFISNFVGSAIVQRYTTGCHCKDVVISMCYAGIDISNTSYDGLCTNIYMNDTRYGVVQNGSNFVFSGCISKDSAHHIMSDQQNTECTFSSCTFFDSSLETTSVLAYLSNARNGFVFDNCMFDSSLKMELNACDGVVIKGTNFVGSDTFKIIVSNGRNTLLLITDCIADVEPVVTNAGTAARITSCYLKDGTAWSISEADITVDGELSDESENPVQNKVVASAIGEIKADLKSALEKIDGGKILEFESGGMYQATGIEYADGTKSRTDFIPVEAGSNLHMWFDITGITSVGVFEFASNTTTSVGTNERLTYNAVKNNGSLKLTPSTNYIRVQINVATSSITNPVIIQNGGYLSRTLEFKGVLPACDLDTVNTNTGIWQLITANSYTNIPNSYDSGWLEVIKTNTWVLQRYINGTADEIWLRRSLDSSSWSDWFNISKDIDLLHTYAKHESWTHRGVTFTWNADGTVCTASGTNDGTNPSASRFYANQYGMPSWITPGETYYLLYDSTGVAPDFYVEFYASGISIAHKTYNKNGVIKVPSTTTGITLRLNVLPGTTVDGTVSVKLYKALPNESLSAQLAELENRTLEFKGVLPSCDLDTVNTNTGIWQLITANSYTNIPNSYDSGWLEVIKTNTWVLQRYINGTANEIWLRRSLNSGSSWSTWINISEEIDLLHTYANHESWIHRGVTFTWNSDNTVCTAVGTNDGTNPSVSRFYANQYGMPSWIKPGKTYYFTYESTGVAPSFFIELFSNGTSIFQKAYRKNDAIRIPLNTTGITLRLDVAPSATVDGTVSVRFDEMMTNLELSKELYDSKTFGIDFLRTYGNRTNSSSHGVSYTSVASVPCKYHISGTVSSSESTDSSYAIYDRDLPPGLNVGDKCLLQWQSEPSGTTGFGVSISFRDSSNTIIDRVYGGNPRMDIPFTIPYGTKILRVALYVTKGNSIDVTTQLKLVKVHPQKMDVPLIFSVVDDDTSTDAFVTKFHDACLHNGMVGNYAVITKNITDGKTSLDKLLDYEDEGFGMLIHCYQQVYSSGSPWPPYQRTKEQIHECRANLAKGMRDMREMGFVNFNHWITPGGRMEKELQTMARLFGMKSMASIGNGRHNTMQDLNRFYIKRLSLHPTDDTVPGSVAGIKNYIDKCVADNLGGWLIITTHFNEWGKLTWDDTLDANGYPVGYSRFNEVMQYAITKGLVPMSYQEAWTYYEPILEANRLDIDEANS